ncbi:MAG TPA: hydrolase [Gammaproteobacteria bacterium]|nr:hydrolase [Gammaproteobacteria bacterium]
MIVESEFKPGLLWANRHVQTIVPNVFFPQSKLALRRERVELPDGDFIDVDWTTGTDGPIVIVLHGLEGSMRSRYACNIMRQIHALGFRGAFLYFRGCSGEPNRLPIGYHSGFTQDIEYFSGLLKEREPGTSLAAVGYSLGGNVLLKWLGESPSASRLVTCVAVSVPFDLAICSEAIEKGFSRVYMWELMARMRRNAKLKFGHIPSPIPLPDIDSLRTFREFDDAMTAPLHGYLDADDYYTRCSSRPFLKNIKVPTLILHSADDPFMTPAALPRDEELPPAVRFELSARGGHVGFMNGSLFTPRRWLDARITEHLREHLPSQ